MASNLIDYRYWRRDEPLLDHYVFQDIEFRKEELERENGAWFHFEPILDEV